MAQVMGICMRAGSGETWTESAEGVGIGVFEERGVTEEGGGGREVRGGRGGAGREGGGTGAAGDGGRRATAAGEGSDGGRMAENSNIVPAVSFSCGHHHEPRDLENSNAGHVDHGLQTKLQEPSVPGIIVGSEPADQQVSGKNEVGCSTDAHEAGVEVCDAPHVLSITDRTSGSKSPTASKWASPESPSSPQNENPANSFFGVPADACMGVGASDVADTTLRGRGERGSTYHTRTTEDASSPTISPVPEYRDSPSPVFLEVQPLQALSPAHHGDHADNSGTGTTIACDLILSGHPQEHEPYTRLLSDQTTHMLLISSTQDD